MDGILILRAPRFGVAATAVAALVMSVLVVVVPPTHVYAESVAPIDLGAAGSFAILAGDSVINIGATIVRGDLGVLAAAGVVTGFSPGEARGTLYAPGAAAVVAAHADLVAAYADAVGRPSDFSLTAVLTSGPLSPGVYANVAGVTNNGTVTLDGGGDPNAVFIFQIGDAFSAADASRVVLANGTQAKNVFWQVNGTGTIGANAEFVGTLMTAAAIDVGVGASFNGRALAKTGAITSSSNQYYSAPPVVTVTGGSTLSVADDTPTISGSAIIDVPATVTVTIAGQILSPVVQADGTWTVTASILTNRTYPVTASVTDAVGNTGAATQSLTVDTVRPGVTINGGLIRLTNDPTPMIDGTTDVVAGSTVTLTVAGQTLSTLAQLNGTWNVIASSLVHGTTSVEVWVHDEAGNPGSARQTLAIDTTAPVVTITGGANALTNDLTPMLAGSATGGTVSVSIDGQAVLGVVQYGGLWTVQFPVGRAPLGSGDHYVAVIGTDAAQNVTSVAQTLTVDTSVSTISIRPGLTDATNDPTPTISGTTDAADGRIIIVVVGGQTMTDTVTRGTWSVTATHLDDGLYGANATVSAFDGNPGAAMQWLTIDTVAPLVIIPGGPAIDTTDATPTISGHDAPPGSSVMVRVAGQTMTTTVGADGTWSVTPPNPLPPGTNVVIVTITDVAGNQGIGSQILNIISPPRTDLVISPPRTDFTSVGPKRVFDTRAGQSPNALRVVAKQQIGGGHELQVQMIDLAGLVPAAGVGAVSLNVTSTGSSADGFITVYRCGTRELVSSVNFPAGGTVANAVIAPVSAAGMVCFYANALTDIVVDINGWFATGAAFTSVGPKRVFDTRAGNSPDALRAVGTTKVAGDTMIEVRLTDLAGYIPADGVGSVSLNVIVTNPEASGFITVYACGTRAVVSSLNFVAGQTVANAVLTPVSAAGTVCFYSMATTDLIVDVNGWLKAGSGFNAIDSARVLDTRAGDSPKVLRDVPKVMIGGSNVLEVRVTDFTGLVPANGVAAVSLNVTATNPLADGFVTVFACGVLEEVSSLNYSAGSTVANAVIAPVSSSGTICLYSNAPTDVIVDINGWIGTQSS